ncbi:F-box protein [Quillaja saponaria]|uniref:F-box protein n=1 Tax=Quillaja saponaria TaxID=32244 RepID=A0AAD7LUF7_QUISA|nr:F-box protein [Quillaja saponaria]
MMDTTLKRKEANNKVAEAILSLTNMREKNSGTICGNSNVGLLCHYQYKNGRSQFVNLDLANESGAVLVNRSLSFFTEDFVLTLASSNGLLLLSTFRENQRCYLVFNPATKQTVSIPQPGIIRHVVRAGLAFDGNQFEVVLLRVEVQQNNAAESSNELELMIFSSDTNKWSRVYPIDLSLPSVPEFEFQELGASPIYLDGSIHWEIGGYLLVYEVFGSQCKLIELPNFEDWSRQPTMTYPRCLWESRGGVYYCHTDLDGLHIWDLLKDNDHPRCPPSLYDPHKFSWRLVHSVKHEIFILNEVAFGCSNDWEPLQISPLAYRDDIETIYLQLPGIVVSYNLETRTLDSVCTFTFPDINYKCCFFFPFTPGGNYNKQTETEISAAGESKLDLPIPEVDNLISF